MGKASVRMSEAVDVRVYRAVSMAVKIARRVWNLRGIVRETTV